ncbi:TonB-dependent receptor [Thalassolituus sp.]|uniref:TonB-dependent receptor n=1 Tax=Thalassolituus sp. TaxID=2030822 RepID=UPI002A82CD8E|nr:TonB-dependent receptor [Thalassolituus sp.]
MRHFFRAPVIHTVGLSLLLANSVFAYADTNSPDSDNAIELETITVTALPNNASATDSAQPVFVLSDDDLERARATSLGETLSQQPGIHNSSFGSAVGRPVIRGLGGGRVSILQDGLKAVDASTVSPDHAVGVQTNTAQQIEVIRGPATLLYGSGAFGGVVNVVAAEPQEEGVESEVNLGYNTVNRGKDIRLNQQGRQGDWGWSFGAGQLRSDDYRVPRKAGEIHNDDGVLEYHDAESSRLDNSDIEYNRQLSAGTRYFFDTGSTGLNISRLTSRFGLPGHDHGDEEAVLDPSEAEEEEGVARVDLKQLRIAFDAKASDPFPGVTNLNFDLAWTDYEHSEGHVEAHDDAAVAEPDHEEQGPTTFAKEAIESRIALSLTPIRNIEQTLGLQGSQTDFSAIGEEALVPSTQTNEIGVFWLAERDFGAVTLSAGARWDRVQHSPQTPDDVNSVCGFGLGAYQNKTFGNTSASLGALYDIDASWQLAISATSALRAPDAEELFSCGAHESTLTYEIGNPDLDSEHSYNLDVSVRRNVGRWTGSVSLYQNRVDQFIYQQALLTGTDTVLVDDLPAYQFTQGNAVLRGGEVNVGYAITPQWQLTAMADRVRGELVGGGNLPRMPSDRIGTGINYQALHWQGFISWMHNDEQTRLADKGETPTPSYQLLEAGIGYRWYLPKVEYQLDLKGTNLLDEAVRYHTSFVKNIVPQPGRGFQLAFAAKF